jgi:hypothetical protein
VSPLAQVALNAFTGEPSEVTGMLAATSKRWGVSGRELARQSPLAPAGPADPSDWAHPDIGWGIVMADRDDVAATEKAQGADAPEPIRRLIAARGGAPIFRYRPDLDDQRLARYLPDGTRQDPEIGMTPYGTARGRLPLYLLILGSPRDVPWRLQYSLNRRHCVGRLNLPSEGLRNYVEALLVGWSGMDCAATRAVVWTVDNDSMTHKMAVTIAQLVEAGMRSDGELVVDAIAPSNATHNALTSALGASSPAVVVTSSHGKAGPLGESQAMRQSLGLPVDASGAPLDVPALLAAWKPTGAIWYAHACCSAGSADGTSFEGLLEPDSTADRVLRAVGLLGAAQAPLPTALLSAPKPLRAFVGHVEPTFDWTLISPFTKQFLTAEIVAAAYPNLYHGWPVGLALREHYRGVGELYGKLAAAREGVDRLVPGSAEDATYYRLTAKDRESLVILGDPTVRIPALPSQLGGPVSPRGALDI